MSGALQCVPLRLLACDMGEHGPFSDSLPTSPPRHSLRRLDPEFHHTGSWAVVPFDPRQHAQCILDSLAHGPSASCLADERLVVVSKLSLNRPEFSGDFISLENGVMTRRSRYSPEDG